MAHGDIKIWRLTPAQIEAYKPGVDLGQPDEIQTPQKLNMGVKQPDDDMDLRRRRSAESKRKSSGRSASITPALYKGLRAEGKADSQIASIYGISLKTVYSYKSIWRKRGEV